MKPLVFLLLGLIVTGCVPTGDFVVLRDEIRQVQADNRKFKETQADLRKRVEEQERTLKFADWTTRLDALDHEVEQLKRQMEETSRQMEMLSARLRETEATPQVQAPAGHVDPGEGPRRSPADAPPPKADGPTGPSPAPSSPGTRERQAALSPTAAYNLAYNYYLKGNYDLAIAEFEDFLQRFPATSLAAHAQYWIGESYYNKKTYRPAIEAYERVIVNYPKSAKVAAALYKAGVAYAELGDVAKARGLLKRVIEDHPQSDEANRAKQKLADLR